MSLTRLLTLPLAFLVLFHAVSVQAAEINAEGAARLKTLFETLLSNQKNLTKPDGTKLDYDGAVLVEQAATYYAVTLPHVRLTYPDGARLDIGMISVNASPHDQPDQWKMAVAIPTPIILMDARQTQAIKINIGAQKAAGIWSEALEHFAKLDAQYKNITVENPGNGFTMQIPELQAIYDFTETAGRWSGPGVITTKNIAGSAPDRGSFKIKEVRGDFAIDQYNPAILKEYRAQLKARLEKAATPADAKTTELSDKLTELFLTSSNGMSAGYKLIGLEATRSDPVANTAEQLRIANLYLGANAKGFLNDKSSLDMIAGFDGLSLNPPPPGYEDIIPTVGNIELALNNIPVRQLAETAKNTMESALQQPEMAQLVGFSLLMKVPAILSQSATTLDVKNTHIGNKEYKYELSGQAKADINAVNNVTAHFKGIFTGLDKLIAKVQAIAAVPTHPKVGDAQSLLRFLQTMKAQGDHKPPSDVYTYDLIMDAQGKTLLNGKPFGAPLGGMPMPPAPAAGAPASP